MFVGIGRARCRVSIKILPDKFTASAHGFFRWLLAAARFTVFDVLTDKGIAFTDRFCVTGERDPTSHRAFARTCAEHARAWPLVQHNGNPVNIVTADIAEAS